jgi:hypothetical protein
MTEDQPNAGDPGASASPPAADQQQGSNVEKDPSDWVTGEEAMTGAQASYLRTLSEQAGEDFDATLNKADASRRIDELQQKTGRGGS